MAVKFGGLSHLRHLRHASDVPDNGICSYSLDASKHEISFPNESLSVSLLLTCPWLRIHIEDI